MAGKDDARREHARRGDGRAAPALPARVPQPGGRDRDLRAAAAGGHRAASWTSSWRGCGKLLADRSGSTLELTDAAQEFLAEHGYDPVYGARPLKRAIQKYLQDPLALKVLGGEFVPGDTILVDAGKDALTLHQARRGVATDPGTARAAGPGVRWEPGPPTRRRASPGSSGLVSSGEDHLAIVHRAPERRQPRACDAEAEDSGEGPVAAGVVLEICAPSSTTPSKSA